MGRIFQGQEYNLSKSMLYKIQDELRVFFTFLSGDRSRVQECMEGEMRQRR
jgi:hypothetical protein